MRRKQPVERILMVAGQRACMLGVDDTDGEFVEAFLSNLRSNIDGDSASRFR